jgi:hypothetical protein
MIDSIDTLERHERIQSLDGGNPMERLALLYKSLKPEEKAFISYMQHANEDADFRVLTDTLSKMTEKEKCEFLSKPENIKLVSEIVNEMTKRRKLKVVNVFLTCKYFLKNLFSAVLFKLKTFFVINTIKGE